MKSTNMPTMCFIVCSESLLARTDEIRGDFLGHLNYFKIEVCISKLTLMVFNFIQYSIYFEVEYFNI